MSCKKPLKAYSRIVDGKNEIVFANNFDLPYIQKGGHLYSTKLELPCGQCIGCRLEYSRQWATRCVLEASQFSANYFVTLTYNDLSLPTESFFDVDKNTGEFIELFAHSLVPKHLQDFIKRLRQRFLRDYDFDNIRFYACGEYGSQNERPHYHLILFNCPLPDLEVVGSNFQGDIYYKSQIIEDCWSVLDKKSGIRCPLGFVTVADVNFNTCAYVARYMLKKHKGKSSDYYDDKHILPEFSRMSLRPGIARNYFDEHYDKIYEYDQIIITGSDGIAKRVRPPRYYDTLYDIFSPEDLKRVKEARISKALNAEKQRKEHTSLNRDDYLHISEEALLCKVKSLKRPI